MDNWNDPKITSHTFRVFSKRLPAKKALDDFQAQMISRYEDNNKELKMRPSVDIQKSRYSHDWRPAIFETSKLLDKICREPSLLLFEVGLVYLCTFNDNKKSNSQKAILFYLHDQAALDSFAPIKMLLAPPGCKNVIYEEGARKESYLARGFVETSIECAPHKIHKLQNQMQGVRKQFGIQHYIAGTSHSIMGDTLSSIATTISKNDPKFNIWDKGQILVLCSQTQLTEDTMFVGDKEDTLDALVSILKTRTQWTDHMENILQVVTVNNENTETNERRSTMDHSSFPYCPRDIILPTDCSGFVYMLISLRSRDFFILEKQKT